MIHRKHFTGHFDENGNHHRAHVIGLPALFIYLQIFIVLFAGLYLIRLKAPQILGTASFSAGQIIDLTNKKRAENGLSSLSQNQQLNEAAAGKAADMLANDYWAHNSPTGKTPWVFISAAGYKYVFAGENLARDFGDATSVVNAWMDSPSHRSNLLDKNFKDIGVAVASGKLGGHEGTLVVQMFGSSISQVPSQQPLAEVASPVPLVSGVGQPSPPATFEPTPLAIASPIVLVDQSTQTTTVLASRHFSIAKSASLALVGFIFVIFMIEVLITIKKTGAKLRPGVIAHLLLLAFVLLAVWYAIQGAII